MLQQLTSNVSPVSKDASISVSGLSRRPTGSTHGRTRPTTAAEAVIKKVKQSQAKKVVEQFEALHDVTLRGVLG